MAPAQPASPLWHLASAFTIVGTMAVHGAVVDTGTREAGLPRFHAGGGTYRGDRIVMPPDAPSEKFAHLRRAAGRQIDPVESPCLDTHGKVSPLHERMRAGLSRMLPDVVGNLVIVVFNERAEEGGSYPAHAYIPAPRASFP